MNGAAFPSPTAEMAEMNRIHYELEYTEGISQRMRIPEMLKMGPYGHDNPEAGSRDLHNVMMQVPERIVMSGSHVGPPQGLCSVDTRGPCSLGSKSLMFSQTRVSFSIANCFRFQVLLNITLYWPLCDTPPDCSSQETVRTLSSPGPETWT